jgi:hypothetical protein
LLVSRLGFELMHRVNDRQVKIPVWAADVLNWTGIAGFLLIPPFVAILAMRAKLPGTGWPAHRNRGFEVRLSRPADSRQTK